MSDEAQTYLSFRIMAPDLDLAEITRNLELTPDHTHQRGEHRRDPRAAVYKDTHWSLDSKLPFDQPLESHLAALLDLLEPHCTYLQALAEQTEIDFYSTIFDINGIQLSPLILKRIANLGVGFNVTVYPGRLDKVVAENSQQA